MVYSSNLTADETMGLQGLWILMLLVSLADSISEPTAYETAVICSKWTKTTTSSEYYFSLGNLDARSPSLRLQVSSERSYVAINGTGNNTIHAFGECTKDLSYSDCYFCLSECYSEARKCRLSPSNFAKGGRFLRGGCYFRYDDYMFFNEHLSSFDRTLCGDDVFVGNGNLFHDKVMKLMRNVVKKAAKKDGLSTGHANTGGNLTVDVLAQCWKFVRGNDCVRCLENAVSQIDSCLPKLEGRCLNEGCYLRYSTTEFYNNTASGSGAYQIAIVVASTCGAVACLLVTVMISLVVRNKISRRKRERKLLGSHRFFIVNRSKINFSYERLEKATNYFQDSNKLGQGGSGSVYKGKLSTGQAIAVKRLFVSTAQWVEQLFNEVDLISGVDHVNLVKLLGCSVTGPECLLVYEYVPNRSLHDHLFDKKDALKMGWDQRFKVVLGTAEGLAFLHEKPNSRIIHRDIKLSNVLLDDDFTPKIGDFGLARIFREDQSHISTGVAGTFGYMAPEYVVHGRLTEKADVYSYGVLIIEVITGVKNCASSQNSRSILHKVWNLNRSGKLNKAIDPSMKGKVAEEGATRVLQIGLVCIQAGPELRPSMSTVVAMLTSYEDIPQPTKPPFLNPSSTQGQGTYIYDISSHNEIT